MPKNEPDASDPLELCAVGGALERGEVVHMAQCLAEEFLSLGHGPDQVMALFRSPVFTLAHRAWQELGEVKTFSMVNEIAAASARARAARLAHSGVDHA